jgi:hypothetical protein
VYTAGKCETCCGMICTWFGVTESQHAFSGGCVLLTELAICSHGRIHGHVLCADLLIRLCMGQSSTLAGGEFASQDSHCVVFA